MLGFNRTKYYLLCSLYFSMLKSTIIFFFKVGLINKPKNVYEKQQNKSTKEITGWRNQKRKGTEDE